MMYAELLPGDVVIYHHMSDNKNKMYFVVHVNDRELVLLFNDMTLLHFPDPLSKMTYNEKLLNRQMVTHEIP